MKLLWLKKLFKIEPAIFEYTIWYSFKVEGTISVSVHTGHVNILAKNEDDARRYFTQMNPHVQINIVTIFALPI